MSDLSLRCAPKRTSERRWPPLNVGRSLTGLGIGDPEPPPLRKPLAEPCADILRPTSLCAPPDLSQTLGIGVILFALHCAAPNESSKTPGNKASQPELH